MSTKQRRPLRGAPDTPARPRGLRRRIAATGALALAATGALALGPLAQADQTDPELELMASNSVLGEGSSILNMFEWNWNSIAAECQGFLANTGYTHIQVSPPQEHVRAADTGTPDNWWIHYQPVSYRLDSRLGTRAQFINMVSTCRANGIGVLADVVINHMAAGSSTTRQGWAGSEYRQFHYPAAGYDASDFHSTGSNYCEISDYNDRWQVQNCHLVGLNDLATEKEKVRATIAAYLQDLVDIGVEGFRVDASKHVPATDLENILGRVSGNPYVVHEVIYHHGSNEPIRPHEYHGSGAVHQFDFAAWMRNHFLGSSKASYLLDLNPSWGLSPSEYAGTFIANHDTVRGSDRGDYLNYYDNRADYLLANVYMMAYPYGVPAQLTDYGFSNFDQGPVLNGDGTVADAVCGTNRWTCQHRLPQFHEMSRFRAVTAGTAVANTWHNDENAFAFGRGSKGYVALNGETFAVSNTFTTSLPAGQYCNVLGDNVITVDSNGRFDYTLGAKSALAIHVGAVYSGGQCTDGGTANPTTPPIGGCIAPNVHAETTWGQEVYITGSVPQLGNWSPTAGVHLSSATYPRWTGQISVPAGTSVEYKYVRINPNGSVQWESGANRTVTVPASGCLTLNDTFRN